MSFEAFRSFLPDWSLKNPKWRPFFKMTAIMHQQVGIGPKTIINSTHLNDLDVLLCFKGYWNNCLQFCSHLKIQDGRHFA